MDFSGAYMTHSSRSLFSTTLLYGTFFAFAAQAAPINIPSSADVGQTSKRLQSESTGVESGDIGLPLPGQQKELTPAQEAALSKVKFTLKSVNIDGNHVLSEDELKSTYESYVGKQISLLEAQTIARKITALYQQKGYVLSQAVVPKQEVKGGVLTIRVVEGFVSSILINGDVTEGEREQLMGYFSNIRDARPVTTKALERNLLLANDLPGVSVKGVLRPSATEFGAADLVVTVTRKMFDATASVDNRGSKYIGPWQHSVTGGVNSALGLFDRTQLRLTTASPTVELRGYELMHEEMIGNQGTRLTLLGSRTNTQPGDSLKAIEIQGQSDLLEAKVTHPFIRARQENLVGRVLFDYMNSDTDVFSNVNFTEDRLRVLRAGGSYNFFDAWKGNNAFDLQASRGLNILNASESGVARTNANGESNFTKFNGEVSRTQQLPSNFSLFASVAGQYSMDQLLLSEQFSLGGTSYGGAYDPADVLGDQGVAGKLELRYSGIVGEPYFDAYQLYTYWDGGRAWLRNAPAGANDKRSLASVGGGVRASLTPNLSSSLEVAVPMTRDASNQGGHGQDPRVFFGATARF